MTRSQLIGLILVIALLSTGAYTLAQDATITPSNEGFALSSNAQSIATQGVFFDIILGTPLDTLSRATLTIEREDTPPMRIPVDIVEDGTDNGQTSALAVFWELPLNDSPELFSQITYVWEITRANGDIARAQGSVLFADPRGDWIVATDPDQQLNVVTLEGQESPTAVRARLQPVYDLLASNTGNEPSLNVILYSTFEPGCTLNEDNELVVESVVLGETPCDPARFEAVIEASAYLVGRNVDEIPAQMVSRFYDERWAGADVPDWFRRGLMQFYDPASKAPQFLTLQQAARANNLLTRAEMNTLPSAGVDADLWNAQSYAMILYIANRIGVDGVFELANDIGSDSFVQVFEDTVGLTPSAALLDLQRWLFTEEAELAYNFSPYQENTPTPTATPTITNTPTITPTLTVTNTPTITPTPRPTRTPTDVPPTVTNTAIPQEIFLLTLTPEAAPDIQTPPPSQQTLDRRVLGIGLIVIGVAVVFLVVGFLTLNRERRETNTDDSNESV